MLRHSQLLLLVLYSGIIPGSFQKTAHRSKDKPGIDCIDCKDFTTYYISLLLVSIFNINLLL